MPQYTEIDVHSDGEVFHTIGEGAVVGSQVVAASDTTYLAGTILMNSGTDGQLQLWDTTQTSAPAYDEDPVAVLVKDLDVDTSETEGQVAYSNVALNSRYANTAAGTTRTNLTQEEADYVTKMTGIVIHGGSYGS